VEVSTVMLHEKFHSFSSFFNYFMKRTTRPKMTPSVNSRVNFLYLVFVNCTPSILE
jgi:hypothetical protein